MQSPFHQACSIHHSTKKTIFDTWNGYYSIPLHVDDGHLTTFITPWGCYCYCTVPQGYITSGNGHTCHYDEIIAIIPQKTLCIDDSLLWSNSVEESFSQAISWLYICSCNSITFNLTKFVFASDTVKFAGFQITSDSVTPCPKYLQAILDFPRPKNTADICSWFGLLNQLSYAFSMARRMLPFRELLKPGTKFT